MPTYKQFKKFLRDKCWNERDYGEGIYDKLIYDFLVEEVKENKEDVLSVKQENPHDKIKIVTPRGETIHINYDFMPSDTSILEKLREELNRRIKDYKELEESVESDRLAGDFFIKRREVEGILYYLTSLETKENKEPTWVDDLQGISKLIEEDVKKEQFTPGQEEPEELFRTCKCDGCKDDVVWLEPNMDEGIPNNMTTTTRERFEEQFDSPYMAEMLAFIETIEKETKESGIQQGREEMRKECIFICGRQIAYAGASGNERDGDIAGRISKSISSL